MPQSLIQIYVHLVFSTKYREPSLIEKFQPSLFAYLGEICNQNKCYPVKIGGHYDHVHVLCLLSSTISISCLLEDLKTNSSKCMKTNGPQFSQFYWQNGYGAFSVHPKQIDTLSSYIENQALHHSQRSFQDEYLGFLKKHKINYDERYLWD